MHVPNSSLEIPNLQGKNDAKFSPKSSGSIHANVHTISNESEHVCYTPNRDPSNTNDPKFDCKPSNPNPVSESHINPTPISLVSNEEEFRTTATSPSSLLDSNHDLSLSPPTTQTNLESQESQN
ncbi:hypothetical protein Salat_0218100 [Sesamum alatum]|uniref:Uncharacterized protein n=1 Tax=Sesamum alatum TaxID=300844 RepID=A0AAE1YY96_9LAMI|nr:hypothetical protein Salat_0218100 [Sesamum alatum]